MQQLGYTRSSCKRDHLLLTADTFVRAPLPGMQKAAAIVHVSPAAGAAFTQYTVEFEPGGSMAPSPHQRFLYVLDGAITIGAQTLTADEYAYLPPDHPDPITAASAAQKSSASAAAIEAANTQPLPW